MFLGCTRACVCRCDVNVFMCLICFMLCKEEGFSPVSLQLLRGGIWICMKCPCLYLCSVLGWGQPPYVWYYVGVKSSFPKGPMCFR